MPLLNFHSALAFILRFAISTEHSVVCSLGIEKIEKLLKRFIHSAYAPFNLGGKKKVDEKMGVQN